MKWLIAIGVLLTLSACETGPRCNGRLMPINPEWHVPRAANRAAVSQASSTGLRAVRAPG